MQRPHPTVLAVGSCFEFTELGVNLRRTLAAESLALRVEKTEANAIRALQRMIPSVLVIHPDLEAGHAEAVARFCEARHPSTRIIICNNGEREAKPTAPTREENTRTLLPADASANDLAALVAYHAANRQRRIERLSFA